MTPMVVEAPMRWRAACPAGGLGFVFPNGKGNAETFGNLMRRFCYPLQEKASIVGKDGKPKYGFHAFRHACASLRIEQGRPVKTIQAVLGHSSVTITLDVYGRLFTRAEDDVELFEKTEQDLMAA